MGARIDDSAAQNMSPSDQPTIPHAPASVQPQPIAPFLKEPISRIRPTCPISPISENGRAAAAPPDLITIPDRLKGLPLDALYRAGGRGSRTNRCLGRLEHVLRDAGVQALGDLDGKRLSEFEQRRACGAHTVLALRTMLLKILFPGVREQSELKPIRMRDYKAPPPAIEVATACRSFRCDDLPMSVRLQGVLRSWGIKRLGELHGVLIREVFARQDCGAKTVNELTELVLRANSGEFAISKEERATTHPTDLLRHIDRLVDGLSNRDRSFVTLRFGAKAPRTQTFERIGRRYGGTYSMVALRLRVILRLMRRQDGPRLRMLLKTAKDYCTHRKIELGTEVVATWKTAAPDVRYRPEFYARLLAKLVLR